MAEAAVVFTSCMILAGHGQDMAQGAASPALSGLIAEVTPLGFIAVRQMSVVPKMGIPLVSLILFRTQWNQSDAAWIDRSIACPGASYGFCWLTAMWCCGKCPVKQEGWP